MAIPSALQEQLEELSLYPDRADKIEALIELAESYKNYSADIVPRDVKSKVPGCESEVFFQSEDLPDGTQTYRFAVDNPQGVSAMALAVILESVSGASRTEIGAISDEVVFQVFGRELSMGKNLGLTNMVRILKQAAARL